MPHTRIYHMFEATSIKTGTSCISMSVSASPAALLKHQSKVRRFPMTYRTLKWPKWADFNVYHVITDEHKSACFVTVFQRHAGLAKSIGPAAPDLADLVTDTPPGGANLLLQMLGVLTGDT